MTAADWALAFCDAAVAGGQPRPDATLVQAVVERLAADLQSDPDEDASNHARRVLNLVTDSPAVIAVMGTNDGQPCAQLGCQYRVHDEPRR